MKPTERDAAQARTLTCSQDVTVLERQEAGRRSLPGMGLRSVTVAAYKRRRFGREQQHDAAVLGASGSA
ncbi:MAG: hypothetical protein E6G33_11870 [Actinobacteria bacterium]|nr:MAG: hypothetical protein E6G33_11870 [Actinomycetota bacterium]